MHPSVWDFERMDLDLDLGVEIIEVVIVLPSATVFDRRDLRQTSNYIHWPLSTSARICTAK